MTEPLNIAFIWHMHQPLYKDPSTGEYTLPWVLLHGTKDYYDMVAILDDFPDIHQTFNLVPSLIEQLNDYSSSGVKDLYRQVGLKDASTLDDGDKFFLLKYFFQANLSTMIEPFARYAELYRICKRADATDEDLRTAVRYFKEDDYRDLQILFNLAWIDPSIREADAFLSGLVAKGRNFTETEKRKLFDTQVAIVRKILPKYRKAEEGGRIELTTSPYYHPILPLLCDSDSAKEAVPGVTLPSKRFLRPGDARTQIDKAVKFHEETFSSMPRGMWPSEGSVSEEVALLAIEADIEWVATDEAILSHSLGRALQEGDSALYRPYNIVYKGKELSFLFRDHTLSDLIGFEYSSWDGERAAEDFIGRLEAIHASLEGDNPEEHIVNIILDGENAWEYYKDDGGEFLRALYTKLSASSVLKAVTVSEFLEGVALKETLPSVPSGSWIGGNFNIWIGGSEDNLAWDLLSETIEALTKVKNIAKADLSKAWERVYAAEGSDWFWWYGDDHSSSSDLEFDRLFRENLKDVYRLTGRKWPANLDAPILSKKDSEDIILPMPLGFIDPVMDGEVTNYFEWLESSCLERGQDLVGAMHRVSDALTKSILVKSITYGFNEESLFLRLDYSDGLIGKEEAFYETPWRFIITIKAPLSLRIEVSVSGDECRGRILKIREGEWKKVGNIKDIASGTVVEFGVPFNDIGATKDDDLKFSIEVDGRRWPSLGVYSLRLPTKDYEAENWIV